MENIQEVIKNGKFLLQKENRICCVKSAVENSHEKNGKGQLKVVKIIADIKIRD